MSVYLPRKNVPGQKNKKKMISRFYLIAIFFLSFPFLPYGFYGTFSVGRFSIHFPLSFPLSFLLGDATGLRGTFPGHPRPFHLTITDIHNNIYTPMGAFPDGTRTRADLAVVAERVLILPSTTLPSAPRRHTHTSMARRRFLPLEKILPLRWDSNPLASGPRPRSTFSDSHAATELP
jgi:hypothetical protein